MRTIIILITLVSLFVGDAAAARRVPFNGILLDLAGNPVRKARVYVKSDKDYTQTNKKGEFGLTDVMADDTLKVLVNKRLYQIPVEGKRSMIIHLANETGFTTKEDERLVSLGFSFVSQRERTTPANFISGDVLRRSGYRDIMSALQGRVPGLNISGAGGHAGEGYEVNIRGTRSFTGSSTPLYFIDSVKVPSFEGLSLNDVDYIEIMKEGSAYGSEGANGAIIVHTFMGK